MLHCVETIVSGMLLKLAESALWKGQGSAPIAARMNRRFGPAVTPTVGALEVVPMSNDLTVALRPSDQNSAKTLFFWRTQRSARLLL
jgi:hypothetical protein